MASALREDLEKAVNDIETYVASKLKEFDAAHADMSDKLKKDLAKSVADIVSETKSLLRAYADEHRQMAANWEAMSKTMAEKRGAGPAPVVSARTQVSTVEGAVTKKATPKRKYVKKATAKKRGRKRG